VPGTIFPRDFAKSLPYAVRGEGIYLYDDAGKRYIDGCSGALISSIGHCVPEVADAIHKQMMTLNFAHPSAWRNYSAEKAAAALAEITPADLNYFFFVSGGSEAVESAIKLSRQYFIERNGTDTMKHLIIGRWNSYHGATLGAMSVGGNIPKRRIFAPQLKDNPKICSHYCYRCPYHMTYPGCGVLCARELEFCIQRVGPENVAGFIAEPLVGSTAGALVPPAEYWPMVREICDRYDVLLLADEVMTGIGRTGKNFALNHWDVVPDILIMAKCLGGGYVPTGGIAVGERIAETIRHGSGKYMHGFTSNANPISAAAVVSVLEYIKKHDLVARAHARGKLLAEKLEGLRQVPIIGDVRGKGLMRGIEIVVDRETREPFPYNLRAADMVAAECLDRGLAVYPGSGMINGVGGDNFLIAPPLTVTEEQLEEIVQLLGESLKRSAEKLYQRMETA
jgi:adenosylmethionine-8-amino-7-oxononanoate aminotransferase